MAQAAFAAVPQRKEAERESIQPVSLQERQLSDALELVGRVA